MYKNVLIHVHNFINLIYDGHSRYLSDRHGRYLSDEHGRYLSDGHGRYLSDRHGRYLSDRHGRYLSDGHGAEDVEEDEAAVGVIVAHQVPVRDALDPRDRRERKLRHDATVKTASTAMSMYRVVNKNIYIELHMLRKVLTLS